MRGVAFRNVPAYVVARAVPAAGAEVDVAFGGAIYAFTPAHRGGSGHARDLPELIAVGRRIKRELEGSEVARHPATTACPASTGPCSTTSSVRCTSGLSRSSPTARSTAPRAVGDVGTDALLADEGRLAEGQTWRAESIVGTEFHARAIGSTPDGLLTEVEGTAFRTGEHRFTLDPSDPLGTGFVLR